MSISDIKWNWPKLNGASTKDFRSTSLQIFKELGPIPSLVREIIQNSIDARRENSTMPVKVSFQLESLPTTRFPDRVGFLKSLQACLDSQQSKKNKNTVAINFYKRAIDMLNESSIQVLKVSDSNTTGLTKDSWVHLVKSIGVSEKQSASAAGSYGFGKYAPINSSDLRTILISSMNDEKQPLFQGKTVLQTHTSADGSQTQEEGFLGLPIEDYPPVDNKNDIDTQFLKKETGLSIYILGFNEQEDWQEKIIISVLNNFLPAIDRDQLIVDVGSTVIKKIGLKKLFREYASDKYKKINGKLYLSEFFEAFFATEESFGKDFVQQELDICGLGDIKITCVMKDGWRKRQYSFRRNGMIIEDKQSPGQLDCIVIVEIIGTALNELLVNCEGPNHKSWSAADNEKDDKDLVKNTLNKIKEAVRETKDALKQHTGNTEINFEGMEQYLPDSLEDVEGIEDDIIDQNINKPSPVTLTKNKKIRKADKIVKDLPSKGYQGGSGTGTGSGTGPGSGTGTGGTGDDGNNDGKKKQKYSAYSLNKIRPIQLQNLGDYSILMSSNEDKTIYMKISAAGDDGNSAHVNIESANINNIKVEVDPETNLLGPIDFKANQEQKMLVKLKNKIRLAFQFESKELNTVGVINESK